MIRERSVAVPFASSRPFVLREQSVGRIIWSSASRTGKKIATPAMCCRKLPAALDDYVEALAVPARARRVAIVATTRACCRDHSKWRQDQRPPKNGLWSNGNTGQGISSRPTYASRCSVTSGLVLLFRFLLSSSISNRSEESPPPFVTLLSQCRIDVDVAKFGEETILGKVGPDLILAPFRMEKVRHRFVFILQRPV
jgi:hypothetical protein